ncbi:diaminopimelate dehydrogenase [Patescibacteria group bacterium]
MKNIAIAGFGNVGRGVQIALEKTPDMRLMAIFTRRPDVVRAEVDDILVLHSKDALPEDVNIDVVILCGGSKNDLPDQGPASIERLNTVDSFDTHADIPRYYQQMHEIAQQSGTVAVVAAGWDPGIFSMQRVLGNAFLPKSTQYTFWGKGVSQGHSDAARQVSGVLDARQYTIPIEEAVQRIRDGETLDLSTREKHRRVVYVVAQEGANLEQIKRDIVGMPDYFADYDTEVIFITKEKMERDHSAFPHGGFVLTSGVTGDNNKQAFEYRCTLENNPEFTASVLVACARAAHRLNEQGQSGAFTMLDIPLRMFSPHSRETLLKRFV